MAGAHQVAIDLVSPWEAPILAVRVALGRPEGESLHDCRISVGTTRGTNAILEGKTTPTAAFINEGLTGVLEIGDQRRLDIFARAPAKPPRVERRTFEVSARIAADGSIVTPLCEESLRVAARKAVRSGLTTAAIALIHAGHHASGAQQELRVAEILREEGFTWTTCSHRVGASSRFEPRARAAVIDAALSGPIGAFVAAIGSQRAGADVFMMTSAGGLVPIGQFAPRESLLSGPAGGTTGALAIAKRMGLGEIITMDMGGTSTDVARIDGVLQIREETTVGPFTLGSPSVWVESVACGGGSILWFDGAALRVGPRSAGASPGPACFGASGPLTLTDANLLLGRVDPSHFPLPCAIEHSRSRASELLAEINATRGERLTLEQLLSQFVEIAEEAMASAIRTVTLRKGLDPRSATLLAFGGCGGVHAPQVARLLGIERVVVPSNAGVLCAAGIVDAPLSRAFATTVLAPLSESIVEKLASATQRALAELASIGADPRAARVAEQCVFLRVAGQENALEVEVPQGPSNPAPLAPWLAEAFQREYARVHGYRPPDSGVIEVERVRVRVEEARRVRPPEGSIDVRPVREPPRAISGATPELIAARLTAIATDMGEQLRRTAVSPNIRDRLDFSCGLLDEKGLLLVNAPHIPIHLGALGPCVRSVVSTISMEEGDVIAVNHPRFGGSHLPDLTVITPVFAQGVLVGYAANRAHHAEIGGTRPGSMPPDARTLAEEGVVVEPLHLVRSGQENFKAIEVLLLGAKWPSRLVNENLMDLRAQVAANELALRQWRRLASVIGVRALATCGDWLRQSARTVAERAIATLPRSTETLEERLDDGTKLRVRLERRDDPPRLTLDFTGTSPQHAGNMNAPLAVTRAAVMYTVRVLAGRTLGSDGPAFPLNEGLMDPIELSIPARSILNPDFGGDPDHCPACAIGQTETSQRLVDLIWRAMGLAACSQGTINNLLFGNHRFGFYETIAGGAGATESSDGESAVHTHISNTRITDPEVLERRYPVRLERFEVRKGSGGRGAHSGGDGAVRRVRFLDPVDLSFLSQHRIEAPYGIGGGKPGKRGKQRIVSRSGKTTAVTGIAAVRIEAGDAFEIETPGGGGWGEPLSRRGLPARSR